MATSIRAIWLLNRSGGVIFSRRYTTVENRARAFEWYEPLPNDSTLSQLFADEIIANRDSERPEAYPVTSLDNGRLWPFALVKRFEVYFLAIPSLESTPLPPGTRQFSPKLFIAMPCVTATFSLLEDLTDIVAAYTPRLDAAGLAELHSALSISLPFGSPIDTDVGNVRRFHKQVFPNHEAVGSVRPSWKPVAYRGRQKLEVNIREEIRAVQYDSPSFKDVCEVFGSIVCRCDVEGNQEITLPLAKSQIDHFTAHPCVRTDEFPLPSHLTFTPPLGAVCVARYSAKPLRRPPIRGFYQMRDVGGRRVRLMMQLMLDASVTQGFDHCEVHFPFKNRPPISNMEASPSGGSVAYGAQRRSLVWALARSLSPKNKEVKLEAKVFFEESEVGGGDVPAAQHDPFFTGNNGYVQVFFKISSFTLSRINIDPKLVTLPAKASVAVVRDFVSCEYVIWNSLGQVRGVANLPATPQQLQANQGNDEEDQGPRAKQRDARA